MSAAQDFPSRNGDADEAAAFWDARLRNPECTPADRTEYEAWRAAHPSHEEAFERLQDAISALRADSGRPIMRAMRDAALRKRRRRLFAWGTAGAAAAAAVVYVSMFGFSAPAPAISAATQVEAQRINARSYATGIGELRAVHLEDGSTVTLNTASRLETRFSEGRRDVTLVAGQALFQVAHDASRPFVVTAGDRQITAIGTQFDVLLENRRVRVVLVEGSVAVERRPSDGFNLFRSNERRELAPGQEFDSSEETQPIVQVADVNQATLWREGRVSFVDVPLPDAVAELNRYSSGALVVTDPSMAELRVNGVFRTSEPQAFVNAIEEYFPIEARAQPGGDTLLVWRR